MAGRGSCYSTRETKRRKEVLMMGRSVDKPAVRAWEEEKRALTPTPSPMPLPPRPYHHTLTTTPLPPRPYHHSLTLMSLPTRPYPTPSPLHPYDHALISQPLPFTLMPLADYPLSNALIHALTISTNTSSFPLLGLFPTPSLPCP